MDMNLTVTMFSSQESFLRIHGDRIWEELCDNVHEDSWCLEAAVRRIPYLKRFKRSQRRRYLHVVVRNVMAQEEPQIKRFGWHYEWIQPDF